MMIHLPALLGYIPIYDQDGACRIDSSGRMGMYPEGMRVPREVHHLRRLDGAAR